MTGSQSKFGFLSWLCLLTLGVVLCIKCVAALDEYPESYLDEVFYVEPACVAIETGHFGHPGLAEQLAARGVTGLEHSTFVTSVAPLWIRTALLRMTGTTLRGLRVADLIIMMGAAAAFAILMQNLARGWRWPLAVVVFVVTPTFIWAGPGRPDLLSLLFGTLALALVLRWGRNGAMGNSAALPLSAGFLLGCATTCHVFGGIFWSVTTAAVMAAYDPHPGRLARRVLWLGAGFLAPVAAVMGWLLHAGSEAWRQFQWLLSLKRSLSMTFVGTLQNVVFYSAARNPLVLVALAGLPWVRSSIPRRVIGAWALATGLLVVWRCASFEGYNHSYEVHLWAALVCLMAITLEGWCKSETGPGAWLTQRAKPAALLVCSLMAVGIVTGYNRWIEAVAFHRAEAHRRMEQAFANSVPTGSRVLASCEDYLWLRGSNVVAMAYHDKMDLSQFDFIVTREPPTTSDYRDEWFDLLPPDQYATFQKSFRLTNSVPTVQLALAHYPGNYRPKVPGLFIYSNIDRRAGTAPSGNATGPR